MVLVLAVLLATIGVVRGDQPVAPASWSDLTTVWVGGAREGGSSPYMRLDINNDGTGWLAVQYLRTETPRAYRVKTVALQGHAVTFELVPQDTTEPVALTGRAYAHALDLQLRGTDATWTHDVTLQPLTRLLQRLDVLGARIRDASGDATK